MKRILCLLIILFSSLDSFAQYRTEDIYSNEVYQLNGGLRSAFGGRSRVVVPIKVPSGCSGIVYTIVATRASDETQNINLALKLGSALSSVGSSSLLASQLQLPRGTQTADAYLITEPSGVNYFEAKAEDGWRYFRDYSRQACQSCAVMIPISAGNTSNTIYLGLRNPSSVDAVNIQLNVVAIYSNK